MIYEVMKSIRNYFDRNPYGEYYGRHFGDFSIVDGELTADFLTRGEWFRVEGSKFNDGVYQYEETLFSRDEDFRGTIYQLSVPDDFIELVEEIKEFQDKYGKAASPYQSESFGGYSYSKGGTQTSSNEISWKSQFKSRLNTWRKI